MKSTAPARGQGRALEGKTLVVTGTLEKYSRDEIEELIAQHGGHAASAYQKIPITWWPAKMRGANWRRQKN